MAEQSQSGTAPVVSGENNAIAVSQQPTISISNSRTGADRNPYESVVAVVDET
jgi:hypothetical protein